MCNARARWHGRTTVNLMEVFEAIAAANDVRVAADSSKAPLLLNMLYLADPQRLKIVHLVRDGRSLSP